MRVPGLISADRAFPTASSVMVAPFVPLEEQIDGVVVVKVTVRPELAVALTMIGGVPITLFANGPKVIVWDPGGGGIRTGFCWTVPVAVAARGKVIPPMISLKVPCDGDGHGAAGYGTRGRVAGGGHRHVGCLDLDESFAVSFIAWQMTWFGLLAFGALVSVGSHRLVQDPGCWTAHMTPSRAESAIVTWE